MTQLNTGENNPFYGKKHPEESKKKMRESLKGRKVWNKGIKTGLIPWNKGKPMNEDSKKKLSRSLKGKSPWNKGKKTSLIPWSKGQKGIHLSPNSEFKKGMIPWNKGKKGLFAGKDNPFYGKRHSEETRKRISEAIKGKIVGMTGKHHSEETKLRISLKNKGKPGPNKGKQASFESREKMSLSRLKGITFEEALKKMGGTLVSNYVNNFTPIKIKCNDGHTFEQTPGKVRQGKWCQICSQGINERICRAFFEALFEKPFPKRKLEWLKNEKGKKMELDGYCEELNLAFEYQGIQHYAQNNYFHSKRSFKDQKSADELKKALCKKQGVILIEIPYTINPENMEKYIRESCDTLGLNVPNKNEVNYKLFNVFSPERLEEAKNMANAKGGKCLSNIYINARSKMNWECKEGHEWEATFDCVKQGDWCQKCGFKSAAQKKIKYSIPYFQKIAQKKGGECLSIEYLGYNHNLLMKCKEGHEWKATPANLLKGKWCARCSHCAKLTIEEMQELAKNRGFKCLSLEYQGTNAHLLWQCKKGHQWKTMPSNIKYRKKWLPNLCK